MYPFNLNIETDKSSYLLKTSSFLLGSFLPKLSTLCKVTNLAHCQNATINHNAVHLVVRECFFNGNFQIEFQDRRKLFKNEGGDRFSYAYCHLNNFHYYLLLTELSKVT